MRVFLTAFGLHNPCAGPLLQSHSAIPIASDAPGGLDLDYSALLLAEAFIIDRTALDFVHEHKATFLGPMSRSLKVMETEGLLVIMDYGKYCHQYRNQILTKTDQLLETLEPWRGVARRQWNLVQAEFEEFSRLYSLPKWKVFDACHYGVVNFLYQRDGKVDPGESKRLHGLLMSKRSILKNSESDELQQILKPLVAQVLINDLLRNALESPFLDWDDAEAFHQRLHQSRWSEFQKSNFPANELSQQARQLFRVVIPELLPGRMEEVARFIRKRKAVESLREELFSLMREGKNITKEWMIGLQGEAVRAQLRAEDRNRVVKWVGRVTSFIPGVGPAGQLAISAISDSADGISGRVARDRFEWYYALQELKLKNGKLPH